MTHPTPRRLGLALLGFVAVATLALIPATAQDKNGLEVVATLQGHSEEVYTIAFSPDGKLVLPGSFDTEAKLWDAATGKELRPFAGPLGRTNLVRACGPAKVRSSLPEAASQS